jgi:alkanesulfonate monooxygenase SsuD/methylene tetrahydromethanopterin reductase-like flavin-dependent oxidoreductase (luciferase family)
MKLVLSILLLPLYSPADVAETVATLDVISDGRVVLGVGLGYRDIEYQAFNVERRHRVGRFLESLELVQRLWTEDEVTYHGTHFNLDNATCAIRPVQQPHPPIWVAANFDTVVRRAGELGMPWFVNPHATLETLERQTAIYKEGLAVGGKEMPAEMPIIKEMHVAATHEEAIRNVQPYLEAKYQAYADWGQDKALPGEEDFRIPFEELARDRFILGSSEEVIQQIEDHRQRVGANHFMFRVWYPGMDARMAMRVVEQMGDNVLPYFQSRYGDED